MKLSVLVTMLLLAGCLVVVRGAALVLVQLWVRSHILNLTALLLQFRLVALARVASAIVLAVASVALLRTRVAAVPAVVAIAIRVRASVLVVATVSVPSAAPVVSPSVIVVAAARRAGTGG